jgi:hypothetical protein
LSVTVATPRESSCHNTGLVDIAAIPPRREWL